MVTMILCREAEGCLRGQKKVGMQTAQLLSQLQRHMHKGCGL